MSSDALHPEVRKVWFTDTLEDINGVARTICAMTRAARKAEKNLVVAASISNLTLKDIPITNFKPLFEFRLPFYRDQQLSGPPVFSIFKFLRQEKFAEVIISTPGPVGLIALLASRLLGLRLTAIYHTDFPQYLRFLTGSRWMESLTWLYMDWFYGACHKIYVNSDSYRCQWIERGIPAQRLAILPRGLDTMLFNPGHRQPDYWISKGARNPVFLYVGRISKEKNLAFLADVAIALRQQQSPVTFAFVGEGPYREELQTILPEAIFTGVLTGSALSAAYASADVFVFPSTTDTFGNVVLEALSSGLPVLVSDTGGPRELIQTSDQGRVLPAGNQTAWVTACEEMSRALPTPESRLKMAEKIHQERNWDRALQTFWDSAA